MNAYMPESREPLSAAREDDVDAVACRPTRRSCYPLIGTPSVTTASKARGLGLWTT
jgi:hypothetical protein